MKDIWIDDNSHISYSNVFVIVKNFLLALTNTLAFYIMELITGVKSLRYRPSQLVTDKINGQLIIWFLNQIDVYFYYYQRQLVINY
jgi:hypothetical protein